MWSVEQKNWFMVIIQSAPEVYNPQINCTKVIALTQTNKQHSSLGITWSTVLPTTKKHVCSGVVLKFAVGNGKTLWTMWHFAVSDTNIYQYHFRDLYNNVFSCRSIVFFADSSANTAICNKTLHIKFYAVRTENTVESSDIIVILSKKLRCTAITPRYSQTTPQHVCGMDQNLSSLWSAEGSQTSSAKKLTRLEEHGDKHHHMLDYPSSFGGVNHPKTTDIRSNQS